MLRSPVGLQCLCGRVRAGTAVVATSVQGEERGKAHHLAGELRRLRDLSGLSGRELARRIGTSQSKVSRIESGAAIPSLPEVTAWASAVGAPPAVQDSLVSLTEAAFTEVQTWRDALRSRPHAQDDIRMLETRAAMMRTFQPSVVPGMLQTAEYARRVFSLFHASFAASDIPAAVASRLNRQLALYEPEKKFAFLITEAAMRWRPGPAELLLAQLDRVASVSTLDNVTVGVIPLAAEAVTMLTHAFVIYEGRNENDALVSVETVHANLIVDDLDDIALYRKRWDRLQEMAITGDEARRFIRALGSGLKGQAS
jgi:transcriptional regulator with XRE-family HTH domain